MSVEMPDRMIDHDAKGLIIDYSQVEGEPFDLSLPEHGGLVEDLEPASDKA